MSLPESGPANVVQLSKPFLTSKEIGYLMRRSIGQGDNIRQYKQKKTETFTFLVRLVKVLRFPLKVLQATSYFYQRFFLFTDKFAKYIGYNFEVGVTALFVSLKMNDFIKKLGVVLQEANALRGLRLAPQELDEQRRMVMSLEKTMMECGSFDFRNYSIEDLLIKFAKLFKVPEKESYLSWAVLNDLYLTELPLQLPAHYNAAVALRVALLLCNALARTKTNYNIALQRIGVKTNSEGFQVGVNQMFLFYIDKHTDSCLEAALRELEMLSNPKKFADAMLDLKLESQAKLGHRKSVDGTNIGGAATGEDIFFQPWNTDIGKYGSFRFVYNKQMYLNEVTKDADSGTGDSAAVASGPAQ